MSWTWISHFTKGNESTSHIWNAHSHTRRQNCHMSSERITTDQESQINTSLTQMVPQSRRMSEPWAKCPNSSSCSKEKFAQCTPVDLLSLETHYLLLMCVSLSPRKSIKLAASSKQRGNGEDPRNKWFQQLLRMPPPKPPSQGQLAKICGLLTAILVQCHGCGSPGGNPGEPDVVRTQPPHIGLQKCYWKWGLDAPDSEANKEARLLERNVCFILEGGNQGILLQMRLSPLTISGQNNAGRCHKQKW